MAGRSVECPECQAKTRASRTGGRRAGQQPSNLPRTMLIGSCIFLVGVLGMLGMRMAQIDSDDDDSPSTPVVDKVSSDTDTGVGVPTENQEHSVPDPGTAIAVDSGAPDVAPVKITGTTDAGGQVADPDMERELNTDRGRELMAAMTDVGISVTGFTADVRGSVSDAVKAAVEGAIQKCQVSVRAPNTEPVMKVELELRGDKLVISAKLIARDQQQLVSVWERSGTVTDLDNKATTTGIIPTNLARDVEAFFKGLRLEFTEARRQFAS